MGLGQGFDVSGGDGIKQQNLRLLAGDSQDGPEQTRKSETLIRNTVWGNESVSAAIMQNVKHLLPKCEDLLIFLVIYDKRWSFWTVDWTKKQLDLTFYGLND